MSRVDAILADLRARVDNDTAIANRHGVSRERVRQIRRQAGIPVWKPPPKPPTPRSPVYWTEDQLAYLVAHADEPATDVAVAIGRGVASVRFKRHQLIRASGVPSRRVAYTAEELALLADVTLGHAEVADRTGRTVEVIVYSRRFRGIVVPAKINRRWTEAEVNTPLAMQDRSAQAVADALGRTTKAVSLKRGELIQAGRLERGKPGPREQTILPG